MNHTVVRTHDVSADIEASDLAAKDIGRLITFGKQVDIASTVTGIFHGQLRTVTHDRLGTVIGIIGPEADGEAAGTGEGEKVLTYRIPHDSAIELD
ncbi:hypothetical protein SEA_BIGGITYBASS_82 [Gordonia phage BiggityBass]|nr:hypothetical protein SEA_BIGGITYBASS_82 [Gordonia phage BiggityBass]